MNKWIASRAACQTILSICLPILLITAHLSAADAPPEPFPNGQAVEAKRGDAWSVATIVKKEGRKYQVRYADGTQEWVASTGVRAGGASAKPATTKPPSARPGAKKAGRPELVVKPGDKIEVKWGGAWFKSDVKKLAANGWILVQYPEKTYEWIQPWRIRKLGSSEDSIGVVTPGTAVREPGPPPKEKPGDPPAPSAMFEGAGARAEYIERLKEDPTFKEADWSDVQQVDISPTAGEWTLAPDPCAAVKLPVRTQLEGTGKALGDAITNVFLSRGEKPAAFVVHLSTFGNEGWLKLEKVDLASGKSVGVHSLDKTLLPLGVSPTGKRVLLRTLGAGWGMSERLEVWSIEGSTPERVLLMIPYLGDKDQYRNIESATFVDDFHVLTVSAENKLAMWDLKTGKAVYTAALDGDAVPAFSAGRKQLAIATTGAILILDPSSGTVLARIPNDLGAIAGLSFSPSGKRLAVANASIRTFDLTSGKVLTEFGSPSSNHLASMLGDTYALVDGVVVDTTLRISLWSYEMHRLAHWITPDGQILFAAKDKSDEGRQSGLAYLAHVQLPHASALAKAKELNPADLMLIQPGVTVSVQLNISGTDEDRKRVETHLREELSRNGIKVADGQPIRVVAATSEGDWLDFKYVPAPGAPVQNLRAKTQKQTITIQVNGVSAWGSMAIMDPYSRTSKFQNLTPEQAVAEASKPSVVHLVKVRLPAYVAKPRLPAWYGASDITVNGPVDYQTTPAAAPAAPEGI